MRKLSALVVAVLIPMPVFSHLQATERWPEFVSIVQLIAAPEKYDGKVVSVIGFLRLEFEGDELYLHKEDYDNHIYKNGIWVQLSPKLAAETDNLNMHYALLVGTFSASNKGHMSMASGAIRADGATRWPPKAGKDAGAAAMP